MILYVTVTSGMGLGAIFSYQIMEEIVVVSYVDIFCFCTLFILAAKKTGCQCFVSLNITDSTLHAKIEDHLVKSINTNPSTFYF